MDPDRALDPGVFLKIINFFIYLVKKKCPVLYIFILIIRIRIDMKISKVPIRIRIRSKLIPYGLATLPLKTKIFFKHLCKFWFKGCN
jgi:hypothetical protein